MLFDWLVTGHVIEANPAHSVRGPRYTVKKGKTPVLTPEEAHALIESIPITKKPAKEEQAPTQPDLLGLRDRALIAMMVYSFARIGAVIQMKVGDYFVQGRRRWVRLHEKGGKEHDVPCHHRLDQCLHDYIEAAGCRLELYINWRSADLMSLDARAAVHGDPSSFSCAVG